MLQNQIHGNVKNDNTQIKWTEDTVQANASLLSHYVNNDPLTLTADASSETVSAVVHQIDECANKTTSASFQPTSVILRAKATSLLTFYLESIQSKMK